MYLDAEKTKRFSLRKLSSRLDILIQMESDRVSIVSGEFQMIENPTGFFAKSERAVYTMLFGLSAHSIFEGLAIGLQDVSSKLWLLAGTGRGPLMIFIIQGTIKSF